MIPSDSRLSVTRAARGFSNLINEVRYHGARYILIKGGKPVASIQPCPGGHGLRLGRLASILSSLPPLEENDRRSFAKCVAATRKKTNLPASPWDT